MTTLTDEPAAPDERSQPPQGPPRSPRVRGRLSTGHLLMLLAGAVAALANYAALSGADDATPVLVAAGPIGAGERFDPGALTTTEADPASGVAERLLAADERDTVVGAVATGRLEAGEPLRPSDVRPAAAPERRRAMSLPVDAVHAVGGELRPGDRVDVIETGESAARYLVTGARVLAVPTGDGLAGLDTGFSLTVAVDADGALRLAEAVHHRDLDVVRSTGAAPVPAQARSGGAGGDTADAGATP